MYTVKERQRYNEDRERVCKRLGITKNHYNWFRRKAEELRKVYEAYCNGDYTKEAQLDNPKIDAETRYGIDCSQIEGLINSKAKELNLFAYYQTDPRGASLYLDTKEIPENNYTQANCIY